MAVIITGYRGDQCEQRVRNLLYRIAGDSIPAYAVEITGEQGIPYVDYKPLNGVTAGKQYNPTIVCNYAIAYFDRFANTKNREDSIRFFNCVEWLSSHLTVKNNYALYIFRWQQPWYDSVKTPYTSGMTAGLAVKVFTLAARLRDTAKHLSLARKLMRGFYVPVKEGGFTYKDADGWWYEELADTAMHTPRILDGHIFAITGIHEYANTTKDDSAIFLVNKGIEALKNRLSSYDAGNGDVYYDAYRLKADLKYHRLITAQMKQVHNITGDEIFLSYHKRWKAPLERWYVVKVIEDRNISGMILLGFTWLACFLILAGFLKLFIRLRKA